MTTEMFIKFAVRTAHSTTQIVSREYISRSIEYDVRSLTNRGVLVKGAGLLDDLEGTVAFESEAGSDDTPLVVIFRCFRGEDSRQRFVVEVTLPETTIATLTRDSLLACPTEIWLQVGGLVPEENGDRVIWDPDGLTARTRVLAINVGTEIKAEDRE